MNYRLLLNGIIFILSLDIIQSRISIIKPLLETIMRIGDEGSKEPSEKTFIKEEYDFIIIGAGTAGSVLANRLSENPNWSVLLIEAGESESSVMDVPLMADYLQITKANWDFHTEPSSQYCLGMIGGRCRVPRGKSVGGSSTLDYMLYYRGHPADYDSWAKLGNKDWSFNKVLPYFAKVENFLIRESDSLKSGHNHGQLTISYPPYLSKLASALMETAKELNIKTDNYNSNMTIGMAYAQTTILNGMRESSSKAYLHPIRNRDNLTVKKSTKVARILIDSKSKRAYGVKLDTRGLLFQPSKVTATKEVILAAGAVGSPKILMLSGIGPKLHLAQNNIEVMQDLKVGYNLMDQVAIGGITFNTNGSTQVKGEDILDLDNLIKYISKREGPMSVPGGMEVCSFHNTGKPSDPRARPNIGLFYMSSSTVTDPVLRKTRGIKDKIYDFTFKSISSRDSFMILPTLLRPKSRGRIMLKNNNYNTDPVIHPHYFSHPSDLSTLIKGIHIMNNITSYDSLKEIGLHINKKPVPLCKIIPFGTDEYWKCMARVLTFSTHQLSGTCKMGPATDQEAVVSSTLKVHGIKGLRVVDASVIPEIISGPINGAVYMIAEKAADLIKSDHTHQDEI